jgi:hypothetical protein
MAAGCDKNLYYPKENFFVGKSYFDVANFPILTDTSQNAT